MNRKLDGRKDNVQKIKKDITNTVENMETTKELIATTKYPQIKQELQEKNERREQALEEWRDDIKDKVSD